MSFTGQRGDLSAIFLRGYLMMLPTIGIYRFWVVTWKRRFYWQNTEIDGDALEYTGTAIQLLIGFLIALAIFLPIYVAFFYLSTQSPEIVAVGYGAVALVLFFLGPYAAYRARRFRLTRTLWRGVRFSLSGSAWRYAFMSFGWTILNVLTLGLIYPLMATQLFGYRTRNTWYGDRQFGTDARFGTIAGPYYLNYFVLVGIGAALGIAFASLGAFNSPELISASITGIALLSAVVWYFASLIYRARETSRLLSTISVGSAQVFVRVSARGLIGQNLLHGLLLGLVLSVYGGVVTAAMVSYFSGVVGGEIWGQPDSIGQILALGPVPLALGILAYLGMLALWGWLGEVVLALGYWKLVAKGSTVYNVDSLRTVRAAGEESPLAGEGLADALNVGGY